MQPIDKTSLASVAARLFLAAALALCAGCYSSTISKTEDTVQPDANALRQRPPLPLDQRKKAAVLDFEDRTDYGQGRLGVSASNILVTYLDRSGQFSLYEREKLNEILAEQSLGAARTGDAAAVSKLGKVIGVDYVFIGAVTGYGYHSRRSEVLIFGSSTTQEAEATVDVRMVEVATGRIVASESGRGVVTIKTGQVLGVGTQAGYDETTASNALRAAISKYVDQLIDSGLANR
jgi:curli biogenesis system outer membrane secretion channel CsgG